MISKHTRSVAEKAKALYADQWQTELEKEHHGKFVAIEPESGCYYLGDTYGEAVMAARESHPHQISFVLRIGHEAAIHIGAMSH